MNKYQKLDLIKLSKVALRNSNKVNADNDFLNLFLSKLLKGDPFLVQLGALERVYLKGLCGTKHVLKKFIYQYFEKFLIQEWFENRELKKGEIRLVVIDSESSKDMIKVFLDSVSMHLNAKTSLESLDFRDFFNESLTVNYAHFWEESLELESVPD